MKARLKHVYCILVGHVSLERLERFMALENFRSKLAEVESAADSVIALVGSEAAELDSEATAALQPVLDKLNAVINPPAPPSA